MLERSAGRAEVAALSHDRASRPSDRSALPGQNFGVVGGGDTVPRFFHQMHDGVTTFRPVAGAMLEFWSKEEIAQGNLALAPVAVAKAASRRKP